MQSRTPDHWVMAKDDNYVKRRFHLLKALGRGSAGEVYLIQSRSANPNQYACKVLRKKTHRSTPGSSSESCLATSAMTEALLHSRLSHPNIVPVSRVYETPAWIYIVMEPAEQGALIDLIVNQFPSGIPESQLKPLFADVCSAVRYLHTAGIAHRDLKPDNMLICRGGKVKLCDFGVARTVHSSSSRMRGDLHKKLHDYAGTIQYAAPELLTGRGHSLPADMWSLGVTLYVLLCGRMPFFGKDDEEQIDRSISGEYRFPSNLFLHVSDYGIDLVRKLLTVNERDRYTIEDVFRHPWMQSLPPICTVDVSLAVGTISFGIGDASALLSSIRCQSG